MTKSDYLLGLFAFDPVQLAWSDISCKTSGIVPSPRKDFGLASAGGKFFVHGGYNPLGNIFDSDSSSFVCFARCNLFCSPCLHL